MVNKMAFEPKTMEITVYVPVNGTHRQYLDNHGEIEEDCDTERRTIYYEPTEKDIVDYYDYLAEPEEYLHDVDFGEWLVEERRAKLD